MTTTHFLKADKTNIVDETGKAVLLKGVALGGWLMMEGYMLAGRNIPEREFKKNLQKALGREALEEFTRSFRNNFIREYDIKNIKSWGANCIRVPFNYRLIEPEDRPFKIDREGLAYLDRIVGWCQRYGLYCILDMHAAPGAQNPDWHSDCSKGPTLFTKKFNKKRYLRLWRFVAEHYKDSSAVAGYDVLNEPVVDIKKEAVIKELYEDVTSQIRSVDKRHIIFLEGNIWGQRLKFLGKPKDFNTAFSIHAYPPVEFTFNLVRDLNYPGKINKAFWNKVRLKSLAEPYISLINKIGVPLYIGEFGVNFRGGYFGEPQWLRDILEIFEESRLSWTYWTYKSVASPIYPDGIYRYLKNPAWVSREGPIFGWENFYKLWKKEKKKIISSWRTENFTRNERLYSILKSRFNLVQDGNFT